MFVPSPNLGLGSAPSGDAKELSSNVEPIADSSFFFGERMLSKKDFTSTSNLKEGSLSVR